MTLRERPARFTLPLIATLVGLVAIVPTSLAAAGTAPGRVARVEAAVRLPPIVMIPVAQRTLTYLLVGPDALRDHHEVPPEAPDDAEVQERMNWVSELDRELIPFVRGLPEFAGIWIDQHNHDRVVVMLSRVDPETRRRIGQLLPLPGRGLEVREATYTWAQLVDALRRSVDVWKAPGSPARPHGAAVAEAENRLEYYFTAPDAAAAKRYLPTVDREVGIPGIILIEDPGGDAAGDD